MPICRQLSLPAGFANALFVNYLGRLTLTEFELWRNPQARREVIGQILDYAKDLASWDYADLQRQVSLALGKSGNALITWCVSVCQHSPGLNEAQFVDRVSRHLRRGEFLLLIIGDGILVTASRKGSPILSILCNDIVDCISTWRWWKLPSPIYPSGTANHFNLAMVEAALYRDASNHLMVQPRVLDSH